MLAVPRGFALGGGSPAFQQGSVSALLPWPINHRVILRLQQSERSGRRIPAICQGHGAAGGGTRAASCPQAPPARHSSLHPEHFLSSDTQRPGKELPQSARFGGAAPRHGR